ncbi:MAG: NTP transferase domain-containing protein [Saprospiraceae bacterium]|nr:NTP transferase domain-containing protein [Saprospiraceae bacterium]
MKKHQKHAKLNRPGLGRFGRNEWAILGTTCGNIKQMAYQVIRSLSERYRLGYADADHGGERGEVQSGEDAMGAGAHFQYIDKIGYHRFDTRSEMSEFQYRHWCNELDAVIVNGNHFPAGRQIVVIDPVKEKSLKKRIDQLTKVDLILLADGVERPYDWLLAEMPELEEVEVMSLSEISRLADLIDRQLTEARPPLYGLVLAGGKSERMGQDKSEISYHGKPQREYLAELLEGYCRRVFVSCRQDQVEEMGAEREVIADSFLGLGPYGAILSAFRQHPDAAWLVVACDLPLLNGAAVQQLRSGRDSSRVATAFHNPKTGFPEPLITIWEPRAYPVLFQFLAQGYSCPRKVLINSEIALVKPEHPETLMNANQPSEAEKARKILNLR